MPRNVTHAEMPTQRQTDKDVYSYRGSFYQATSPAWSAQTWPTATDVTNRVVGVFWAHG